MNVNWTPVPFQHVKMVDGFWTPWVNTVRSVTARVCLDKCEQTGRLANFRRAAKREEGGFQGIYYNDSDVYKVLEGVAYVLMDNADAELEQRADAIIDDICAAQWEDGYINTFYTLTAPEKHWTDMGKHEDYCIGHMIEGAIAYYQATGKDQWLKTAIRAAEHMMATFGSEEGKRHWVVGHQEPELALVKLYRLTGRKEFLDFSAWLINERGHGHLVSESYDRLHFESDYCQDDLPARDLSKVVGHAVRAMYYYSGMADIAMLTDDEELAQALRRLWDNVSPANLYITGGIGQDASNEGFTRDWHLPNLTAYCETCASIGMALWNQRMNLMDGETKYADIVELELYNGALAGMSISGDRFFYENPLASVGTHHRRAWYDCSCCPTNLIRFIPSVGGYAYATDNDVIIVNQYLNGSAEIPMKDGEASLSVKTDYPFDGRIAITVNAAGGCRVLRLRIPGWCSQWSIDRPIASTMNNYVDIVAETGDTIVLTLEMPVRLVSGDERVAADKGRIAVARGPIIYCAEEVDNPCEAGEYFHADLVLGAEEAVVAHDKAYPSITIGERVLVPYFAWDNREKGAMTVWMRKE